LTLASQLFSVIPMGHFVLLHAKHVPVQGTKYTYRLFATSLGISFYHLERAKVESIRVFDVIAEHVKLVLEVDRDVFQRTRRHS
jgi:hypothetical protein